MAIPPSEMIETIEKQRKLDIIEVGLGNIYVWRL